MPGQFNSPEGDLESIFVNDAALIDQYVATGSLWLWGRNQHGQLGDNTITDKSSPVQTIAGGTNWNKLQYNGQGRFAMAGIKTDGTLWLWGNNQYGQLADNTNIDQSSPVQTIAGGTNWKQIASSESFKAAIKTDGTLWTWGMNKDTTAQGGFLGDNTNVHKSSPIQTIAGGTNWKLVSCGTSHVAAIKTDGTLWIWGRNQNGQLGDNSVTPRSSPVQTVAGGTNWKQVSGGSFNTAAIKTDGTLWTWGMNFYGTLGDGNNGYTYKSSPVQTIAGGTNWKQVSCGGQSMAAIKTDGTLWTWGYNYRGSLGDNTSDIHKSSPVQTVAGGTNWKQVSLGGSTVTAVKTDGTLWTWGFNGYNQLGVSRGSGPSNPYFEGASSPIQTLAGGTNWKEAYSQDEYTTAIYFYDANNQYPNA